MNKRTSDSRSILRLAGMILVAVTVLTAASAGASELHNGEPVSVSGSRGEEVSFFVEVPTGARFLRYEIEVDRGKVDLYMKVGAPPTRSSYDEQLHGEDGIYSKNEDLPLPGTWYFMLRGIEDFSDVRLQVDFWACEGGCHDGGELSNGVPVTGLSAREHGAVYFLMDTPLQARKFEFSLSGGTGDADLYVRFSSPPPPWYTGPASWFEELTYPGCVSKNNNNEESCSLDPALGGNSTWYVIVYAYHAFSDVTLLVRYGEDQPAGCTPSSNHLCLNRDRFRVEVDWRDFQGGTGRAEVVPGASADSGLFWFFSPDNWEMLVKVLDGCGNNGHYWVFAAATTTVEYTLRVTDTETGDVKEYVNPLGVSAAAVTDAGAFATCP